jgi:anthranilate phosphoribosyltransferase
MKQTLQQLVQGQSLTAEQAHAVFDLIMTGQSTPAQTGALLAMIQQRGPSVDEIVGATRVMRERVTRVAVPDGLTAIDLVGTGGDHARTFNISTAASLVAAAAARPHNVTVAKHGNKAVTSNSGSSQVLRTLGVKLMVKPETLTKCLSEAGICFCFAPAHHPAMKYAAPIRADLGFRTIFNILGPLTNPAGAKRQVLGVYAPSLTMTLANVLNKLGCEHAMVVHGQIPSNTGQAHGTLDELSTCGPSQISHVKAGQIKTYEVDPTTLGLPLSHPEALHADGPDQSAGIIRKLLDGAHGPARDIVCLNAAAALVVADIAEDLVDGLERAAAAIDSGEAKQALDTLVALTQADPTQQP